MKLDFSNQKYRDSALNIRNGIYDGISPEYAFFLCINGLDYDTLYYLCEEVSRVTNDSVTKTYDELQNMNSSNEYKKIVLSSAYNLIHSNMPLGKKIIDGKFNASDWITHSLFEGEIASIMAKKVHLNENIAMRMGILHDIGRKFTHSFNHVIKGYEYLYDLGYQNEALCTLTHSFISNNGKGNRCANCDPAIDGFYIDENGNGVFKNEEDKDDITIFLENYNYSLYDRLLNISDLLATSKGIITPYDRVMDVYTRKTPDNKNSHFFKVCFINELLNMLYLITNDEKYYKKYNINNFKSNNEIDDLFKNVSSEFSEKLNIETDNYELK